MSFQSCHTSTVCPQAENLWCTEFHSHSWATQKMLMTMARDVACTSAGRGHHHNIRYDDASMTIPTRWRQGGAYDITSAFLSPLLGQWRSRCPHPADTERSFWSDLSKGLDPGSQAHRGTVTGFGDASWPNPQEGLRAGSRQMPAVQRT